MTMLEDSTYNGTDITFDNNTAEIWGGALFATTESNFICSTCTFTNNKA